MSRALFALVLLVVAVPCAAQEDAEGFKDHPVFPRHPSFFISSGEDLEFGAYDFATSDEGTTRAEGKYTRRDYTLKEDVKNPGAVAVARNYRNAIAGKGGKTLFDRVDNSGGTFCAVMTAGGARIWVQVDLANGGEVYSLHVVEEQAMAQRIELGAEELARALREDGHVAVRGILFDTAKATIKPESAAALAPIIEVLKADASLRLEIQGHTDNVGTPAANLKLSQERAAAVKAYLVTTGGIAGDRLTTAGFGDTRPVADNATEAGRAQNRRVELVRK